MKINSFLILAFLSMMFFSFTACSDDDDNGDPVGVTALNMMNEENGKTKLGNSDVYIDKANNFHGTSSVLVSLGKKNGLTAKDPVLQGINHSVAVGTGNAYQIFNRNDLREFPSGKIAIDIHSNFYNVLVSSEIIEENKTVGSTVKFLLTEVPDYGLPLGDESIGEFDYIGDEIRLKLPTSDFEYLAMTGDNEIAFEKVGNELVMKLENMAYKDVFGIYIRVKEGYTYVYGKVG